MTYLANGYRFSTVYPKGRDGIVYESKAYQLTYKLDKNGVQRSRPDTDSVFHYRVFKSGKVINARKKY